MKRALPAKRSAPVCYLRSNRQAGELGRLLLFMCLEQADNANDQDPDLNQISKRNHCQPPFQKDMGAKKRLPESKGANRLPLIDSAKKSIP